MKLNYFKKRSVLHITCMVMFTIISLCLKAQPNITRVEYYIDTDPGFGNGISVTISPSANIQNIAIPIDPASVTVGGHTFFVRAQDADGSWSLTNRYMFFKPYVPYTGLSIPKLKQLEYYIDTDPGYGLGIPVALDTLTDFNNYVVPINVTGLATGDHQFFLRGLDRNGSWSLVNSLNFTVPSLLAAPSIVVNSITKTTRCARDSFAISYDASGTYNSGNVFNVQLSNAAGSFASPTVIGTYNGTKSAIVKAALPSHLPDGSGYKIRVVSTSPVVTGIANETTLTIHDRPYQQTLTGAGDANNTFSYVYTVPTNAGSSWQWISPQASISQTNNSAILTWNTAGIPDDIQVVETNQFGCVGDTSIKAVNVYNLKIENVSASSLSPCPADNISITGSATGVYNAANQFIAQLSDASGSFANPVNIGSVTANPVGASQPLSINASLPFPLVNGSGYRVRIVANSPAVTSVADNGQNIIINKPNLGIDLTVSKCPGFTTDISSVFNTTGLTTQWNTSSPSTVDAGIYQLMVTNSNGCRDTANVTVTNFVNPNLGTDKSITIACINGTGDLTTVYNTSGYSNVAYSSATPTDVPAGNYSLIVTDVNGCKDTANILVQEAVMLTLPTMANNTKIASRECTTPDGWTNYYNDNGTPADFSDDILLLSIKKNGNNIGTIGDGTFSVKVAATAGAASNTGVNVASPLVPSGYHFLSANRYWMVNPTTQPVSNVTVRFYYNTQDLNDINGGLAGSPLTHGQLTINKLSGGNADPGTNWLGAAAVNYYNGGGSPTLNSWVYTDLGSNRHQAEFLVSSFSGGGVGALTTEPLPVTFISFKVALQNDKVVLRWSTATEINSSYFNILRSLNGVNYEKIGTVNAAGNSTLPMQYRFDDIKTETMMGQVIYYRIEEKDLDGRSFYTDIQSVNIPAEKGLFALKYNPVQSEATLLYWGREKEDALVRVIDHLGRLIIVKRIPVLPGLNEINIPTSSLINGIYEVELKSSKFRKSVRMLKE